MAYGSGPPPLEYGLIFIGIWAVATYFSLSYPWEKLFYQKVSSTRTWIFLFCSLLYPQPLEQCLAH